MAEDNFHCKVCFEDYNEDEKKPKILGNCGHTFCLECISGLFKSSPSPECPFCLKRVGMFLSELKDNYALMELLPTKVDRSPKFFCEVCDKVAARHCVDHHSIRSFASIAAEKIKKSKENLKKKLDEEKFLLKEVHSALQATLQAVQQTVVEHLECELDLCQKRMEHLNHLSQDFEVAQSTVSRNGDLHLLSVFDLFDNKDECVFLHKAIEVHAKAAKCQLTLHSTDKEISFSLGQSDEDQALAYLISILSNNKTQPIKGNVKSVTSEVTKPEVSREIYVGGIKYRDAYFVLKALFSPFGKIMNIMVQARPKARDPTYAIIEFEDERSALNVLDNKDLLFSRQGLQVKPKITGEKRNSEQPQQEEFLDKVLHVLVKGLGWLTLFVAFLEIVFICLDEIGNNQNTPRLEHRPKFLFSFPFKMYK